MTPHNRVTAARSTQPGNQRDTRNPDCQPSLVALAVAALMGLAASPLNAAPLALAQVPQGNGGREPAPNIIVTVDDSGSMSANDAGSGRTRMEALREALTTSFSVGRVVDDSIRVGYQAMWRCRGFGASRTNAYGGACPENRIRTFSGAHRTSFNTWVNSLQPWGWTPSHLVVQNAGDYMKTTGIENPYAKTPGTQETPLLECRKAFHIFMTDGQWNSTNGWSIDAGTNVVGNADGTSVTLPDGVAYDASAASTQTRAYRDTHGGAGGLNTLSDLTFSQWATDLQPSLTNGPNTAGPPVVRRGVQPIIKVPGTVSVVSGATTLPLEEYWNPRNDPATWQHLVTYSIGFGPGAALSTGTAPRWGGATGTTWSGGDYNALLAGTGGVVWGNPGNPNDYPDAKSKELWHMALNGRGRYVSATNTAELTNAFSEILNQILLDSTSPIVAVSASTQTARADTLAFVAGYSAVRWSGDLTGYGLTTAGAIDTTVVWNASAQLDLATPANRKIITQNDANGTSLAQGTTFLWGSLASSQQSALQSGGTVADGQDRVNYLRGDRSLEASSGGPLRTRASRLGDIVNSSPWSVGKPNMGYLTDDYMTFRRANDARLPMVYVGANDGMLHGFAVHATRTAGVTSLIDGSEKMAYVPRGAYAGLATLTSPSYVHRYFVDGKPFSSDFNSSSTLGSPAWRTALVGTLAGGGKGFFVLDVTNPSGFATANTTDIAQLVITDKTDTFTPSTVTGLPLAATWSDIGHMYSPPTQDSSNPARVLQITKLNNNRWALLMGNGINSTNETAVLLIQYLDGNKELVKLTADATVGGGNGLSNPLVVDLNGDDKADVAYAGDMQGNLWKFDLTSATPSNWSVAFNGNPLFVARGYPAANAPGAGGERQAITTAPTWSFNPNGGVNLVFGTGRDVTPTDAATTTVQTIYSVWDNTAINLTTNPITFTGGTRVADSTSGGRTSLLERTQTAATTTAKGRFMTTSTATDVVYTGVNAKRGWFFNLPEPGERVIANPKVLDKRLVAIPSIQPTLGSQTQSSDESCEPSATPAANYITVLDAVTGKPYAKRPFFDTNGDGVYSNGDVTNASRVSTGKDPMLFIPIKSSSPFETGFRLVSSRPGGGAGTEPDKNAAVLDDPARVNWRQLQ